MPRQARLDAPGALHHVIGRGIERSLIFEDDQDRERFLDRLRELILTSSTRCYAWALMPNHFHLLLRTADVPLSRIMRRLMTSHAVYFNLRHDRHGHLFQNRYKSILCQEDSYLLELVRYIHLNPLRGELVKSMDTLDRYPFSGHSSIMGTVIREWHAIAEVLGYFGSQDEDAKDIYHAFMIDGVEQGQRNDLIGGGIRRIYGDWEEVRDLRKEGIRIMADERILGDSEFVGRALEEEEKRIKRSIELRKSEFDYASLAEKAASIFGLSGEDILMRGNERTRVKARSLFCYWAVRALGRNGNEIARILNMTPAAVSYSVKRGKGIAKMLGLDLEFG